VAASFQVLGALDLYIVYFPNEVIEASLVQAVPGGIAFAGSYVLSTSIGLCADTSEAVQLKYAEGIDPSLPKCGLVKSTLGKLPQVASGRGGRSKRHYPLRALMAFKG
jgi:hypothetical protein